MSLAIVKNVHHAISLSIMIFLTRRKIEEFRIV